MDLVKTIFIEAAPKAVLDCWKDSQSLSHWLTPSSIVEYRVGGSFEIFLNSKNRKTSPDTVCQILSIQKDHWIDFEWKGPKEFAEIMHHGPFTWVRVEVIRKGKGTKLTLTHKGWRYGTLWEEARTWHDKAWERFLSKLKSWVEEQKTQ
jgi:uncharacterized protein YndB with AHSA1/START domain